MRVKATGRQQFASAGADCVAVPVGADQEHCLPPSLWVPGSLLWNMLPSHRDRELQQIGLEAKSVPKGSFTTAEESCFEKEVQDKNAWLFQETLKPSRICFQVFLVFFSPSLFAHLFSLKVELRA